MLWRSALALLCSVALFGCTPPESCTSDEDCDAPEVCASSVCRAPGSEDAAVVIESFIAAPSRIAAGDESELSWRTRNASTCSLMPGFGPVPRVGGVQVTPSATTTWTLSCEGVEGPVSGDLVVEVIGGDGGIVDAGAVDGGGADGGDGDGGSADAGVSSVFSVSGDVVAADFPAEGLHSLDTASLWLVPERFRTTLSDELSCDGHYPTTYGSDSALTLPTCVIAAGAVVDSWLLHAASVDGSFSGTVTFDSEIVALLWTSEALGASDPLLGAVGAEYGDPDGRDLGPQTSDEVVFHDDRRTLTLSFYTTTIDELRVLVRSPGAAAPMVRSTTLAQQLSAVSLEQGEVESFDTAVFLLERTATLTNDLPLDVVAPGEFTSAAELTAGSVPAGAELASALVHYDPPTPAVDAGPTTSLVVSATMPGRLWGLAINNETLADTDERFGHTDTVYSSASGRYLELPPGTLWVSPDKRSFAIELTVGTSSNGLDDVRVIYEP